VGWPLKATEIVEGPFTIMSSGETGGAWVIREGGGGKGADVKKTKKKGPKQEKTKRKSRRANVVQAMTYHRSGLPVMYFLVYLVSLGGNPIREGDIGGSAKYGSEALSRPGAERGYSLPALRGEQPALEMEHIGPSGLLQAEKKSPRRKLHKENA